MRSRRRRQPEEDEEAVSSADCSVESYDHEQKIKVDAVIVVQSCRCTRVDGE